VEFPLYRGKEIIVNNKLSLMNSRQFSSLLDCREFGLDVPSVPTQPSMLYGVGKCTDFGWGNAIHAADIQPAIQKWTVGRLISV